ncbi:MAG TPA: NAD(P)H-binding protein [Gemmatimonadales bacterium]|nr:NAD(P)H-binding protein [Gemmatimonadales bacterium]
MNHILVLGGSGPTGAELTRQALEQGHTVTALSRHPGRLAITHPRIRVVAADLTAEPDAVARVLPGHDAVVCLLGVGTGLRSGGLMARATPPLITAMERGGVPRLVLISAFGVGGTAPHAPWIARLMFRLMLADIYADKAIGEGLVRASALQWTILAPMMLANGPGTGHYRLLEDCPEQGPWRVRRADVATAVLRCIDDPATIRKRLVVAA